MDALRTCISELDDIEGSVSVWCGLPGAEPAVTLHPDTPHYPASTMKIGVMAAAYRLADAGEIDLDAHVEVHDQFTSAVGGVFTMDSEYDSDPQVWRRLHETASLRWLIRRMIVRSSNLATNLVLEQVGYQAAQEAYRAAGAADSLTRRGIEDYAARDAGVDNEVTAADLAAQLSAIHQATLASPRACAEMLQILRDQEIRVDFSKGMPDDADVALKNGWITGLRHSAALVYPTDADAYVLVACATSPAAYAENGDDEVCRSFARLSAAAWQSRRQLAPTRR